MSKNFDLDSKAIAELMLESISALSPAQQELLFQTKKEQTFSSLLAAKLQANHDPKTLRSFVELKGVDKVVKSKDKTSVKKNRNTHDVCLVDEEASFHMILENKVWYHFDGAKGKNNPKPEKGIGIQIKDDIFKIRQTLSDTKHGRGFLLLNIVTPGDPDSIPKSYQNDHQRAWSRTNGDFESYRSEGLDGIKQVLKTFEADFLRVEIESSDWGTSLGAVDSISAEVKIN